MKKKKKRISYMSYAHIATTNEIMMDDKESMRMLEQSGVDVNSLVEKLYQRVDEDLQRLNENLQNKFINELKKLENERD